MPDKVGKEYTPDVVGVDWTDRGFKGGKGNVVERTGNAVRDVVDGPNREVPGNIHFSPGSKNGRGIGDVNRLVQVEGGGSVQLQHGWVDRVASVVGQTRPVHLTVCERDVARTVG